MAVLKIKIMSSGKIPGYKTSGPVLNPIEMKDKRVLKLISLGIDVRILNEEYNEYRKYNLRDMIDYIHDLEHVEKLDENHECGICGGNLELHKISSEQAKSTPSSEVYVQRNRYNSEVEENVYEEDVPDFGDAYEAPPIEAFGLDDFEEK